MRQAPIDASPLCPRRRQIAHGASLALAALGWAAPALSQPASAPRSPASDIAAMARGAQARLPHRLSDEATVVAVRAEGAEFVSEISVSVTFDSVERLRTLFQGVDQRRACDTGANFERIVLQLGGTLRNIYTDPAGRRFETRVSACP